MAMSRNVGYFFRIPNDEDLERKNTIRWRERQACSYEWSGY